MTATTRGGNRDARYLMGGRVRSLSFTVYGEAVPQGSKRAIVHRTTQRAVVIESGGARLKTWRSEIVSAAREELNGGGPFIGPVKVTVFFYLRRPKRPKAILPITRPDVDKLTRAVLDALEAAGVVSDDAQVATLSVRKRYGEPRAEVFVNEEAA